MTWAFCFVMFTLIFQEVFLLEQMPILDLWRSFFGSHDPHRQLFRLQRFFAPIQRAGNQKQFSFSLQIEYLANLKLHFKLKSFSTCSWMYPLSRPGEVISIKDLALEGRPLLPTWGQLVLAVGLGLERHLIRCHDWLLILGRGYGLGHQMIFQFLIFLPLQFSSQSFLLLGFLESEAPLLHGGRSLA